MKINRLKINGFGKLINKEIIFSDGINIVEGKNESGKSTLVKYIISMLYGASKNKRGKDISDMEKYTPWGLEEYSGTMEYTLDNKTEYEIFRNFQKKSVKIFDKEKEDISKQFHIDKTKGNEFFYEQTKIDENLFTSSFVSMQQELKLKPEEQNTLLQKVTNLVSTGEDSISFKKSIEKLNKKLTDEIGTNRTQNKPINIIENRIGEILKQKEELKEYKNIEKELVQKKDNLEIDLSKKIEEYNLKTEIKKINENQKAELQKIQINEEIKKGIEEKEKQNIKEIENIKKELEEKIKKINIQKNKNKKRKNIIYFILGIFLIIINILSFAIFKNNILSIISGIVDIIIIILFILNIINNNKAEKNNILEEIKIQIKNKEKEIELLKQNKLEKEEEIKLLKNNLKQKEEQEINKIKIKYLNKINNEIIDNILNEENKNYYELEEKIQEEKLEIHKIKLEQNNILPKLEEIADLEEELEKLEEQKENLKNKIEEIQFVIKTLEESYIEMKQKVVPKFTLNLSNTIEKISSGKYKTVKINENNSLIIEAENGDYISIDLLSIGTIDQLYLSLRLSILKEITEEKIPIILDESFAYFDTERLKNILKYINDELKENQIIIFTCTKREENILKELNINFKKIELI